jgi:type I restriction enzyme M protein
LVDLVARDKANLDLVWLTDPALAGADDDVPPEIIAREIVEDLQAALLEFEPVAAALEARASERAALVDGNTNSADAAFGP